MRENPGTSAGTVVFKESGEDEEEVWEMHEKNFAEFETPSGAALQDGGGGSRRRLRAPILGNVQSELVNR